MSKSYEFSKTFQEKIIAVLLRDSACYTLYKETIKPKYFELDIHIDLTRIIFEYYETYKNSPTMEALLEEIRQLCKGSKIKREKLSEYVSTIERIVSVNLEDAEYVKDKIVLFGQKQALTEAILKSAEDIEKGNDFERVKTRIDDAVRVGTEVHDMGTSYFNTIEERISAYNKPQTIKISTGIDLLDKVMAGGLSRGELGIVIAPPGSGKTLSLVNFGASAIIAGMNVLHLTFEMSEERVTQRYDVRFIDKTFDYIKENQSKVSESLKRLSKMNRGELVVKEYPTRTCTVNTIRSLLTKLRTASDFTPDLLILDYPDIMKPTRDYGEKRHELELLYEEIRAMAQEFNLAVWGASQTNRAALAKKVVTIADLAESFGKAAVADFMIALSQTKEEKRNNEVRYYVAKNRNGTSDETIHCDIFYDKMKVQSNIERQNEFNLRGDSDDDEDNDVKTKSKGDYASSRYKKFKDDSETKVSKTVLSKLREDD